jgi:membrane protease YdiL (CAAX protease family)
MTMPARRLVTSVLVFTGLAYAVSWLIWLPQVAAAQGWVDGPAWRYFHLLGGIGPMVAGVLLTWRWSGADGLRRLVRRCLAVRDWRWNLVGLFGPVALFFAAVLVVRVVDGSWPDLSRFGGTDEFASLGVGWYWLGNLVFYGFGEEVGWRGVLLPRLQARMSAFAATLIVAVIWTAWHLPLFSFVDGYAAMDLAGFGGLFFSFLTGAVIMTWLFNASGGNLLALALFHASLDITINTPTDTDLLPTAYGAAITLTGLALLWRYGWRNLAPRARVTEPPEPIQSTHPAVAGLGDGPR